MDARHPLKTSGCEVSILRIIVHLYLQNVNVVETKLIMFAMLSPIEFIRCFK